ncbi:unnamed protein product [marine sediment metagenome]|uniref:Uncharacterized protein n=1 Tax=marine sediment metagenome TaxID=412755 RepID=X1ULL5_9ZZZZ
MFSNAARFHPLVQQPDRLFEHDEKKTKTQLANKLDMSWDEIEQALYADVMAFQRLEEFAGYSDPGALLSRYNVAQLQASLYKARSMAVVATDDLKTILRYAKLARLLHEIERLLLGGPSTVRCYALSIMPASSNERFNKSDRFSLDAQYPIIFGLWANG